MVKDKEKKQKTPKSHDVREANKGRHENDEQSGIWKDERFQHLVTDPRFKQLPKSQRKVKIDKRFQSMFTDKKFNVKYTVDKYGRRVNTSAADDLRKYYELDSSASEEEKNAETEQRLEEKAISRQTDESDANSASGDKEPGENDALDSDGEEEPKTLRERLLDPDVDYARGHGRLVTDSSSGDESTEEEEDPELQLDHVWGELDREAATTEESTRRLAVCNMDWDRIRATDLMVLFTSFLPPGGSVLSVKIYQSEYGKQRLAEEERRGPLELVGLDKEDIPGANKRALNDSDSDEELVGEQDSDAEEGDEFHMEKLRQYQLNRLRYYYAVVECDSVNTADKIYQECDGNEYESSATRIDLRFIPDDTTFDEDEPTEVCTELPDYNSYQPRQFVNTALQQAKVDLTWDETAVERVELSEKLLNGKLEDVTDADIRKIVAYSSEEDEDGDDEAEADDAVEKLHLNDAASEQKSKEEKKPKKKKEDAIAKYKALLAEINEQEEKEKSRKCELSITWDIEGKGSDSDEIASDDSDAKTKQKPELTPIEKVLQKRSEKNKKRKDMRKKKQKEALGLDPNESGSDSEAVPDDIDMNDPYFAEEFANGEFAAPKTKTQQKSNKQKKKFRESDDEEKQKERELQLLLSDDDMAEKGKQHFSLSKIMEAENETKSKRKRRKQLKKSKASIAAERKDPEDNFQLNLNDERFGAVYSSHLFNIDPTDSHFKQTKGIEQIINEKLKRRHGDGDGDTEAIKPALLQDETLATKRPKKELENQLLVKSLKRKIQMQKQ